MTSRRWVVTALAAALVTALVAALPAVTSGQTGPPAIDTTIGAQVISVGDQIAVTVTVTHAPGTEVRWPDPIDVGPFELLASQAVAPDPSETPLTSRLELTVTAFELGELSIPPIEAQVVDAGGAATTLSTSAAVVSVESVGRDESGEIRDIRGPLAIPFDPRTLLPWLAGLAALAGVGYWLYRRYRGRRRPEQPAAVAPARPAHEVAYESLAALEASGLLELGEIKTYHIRISDIMRVYAEGRFGVDAMEMTTGELAEHLHRVGAGRGVVADFRGLLDRCDLVKFAKFRPDAAACRDLAPLGRRLVDVTTPAAPAPAAAAEAVA